MLWRKFLMNIANKKDFVSTFCNNFYNNFHRYFCEWCIYDLFKKTLKRIRVYDSHYAIDSKPFGYR